MIKTDIKAYKIVVDNKDSGARATLICVSYQISLSARHYGAEFYELVSTFDNSSFKIPDSGHTFTFQEELRIFSTGTGIAPTDRLNIENWIKTKMKEAYGTDSEVTIENFPTK